VNYRPSEIGSTSECYKKIARRSAQVQHPFIGYLLEVTCRADHPRGIDGG
jgi:hypothetical protein